jgi:hypothetical protein
VFEIHCTIAALPAEITSPIVVDDNYLIEPAPAGAQPAVTADQALNTADFQHGAPALHSDTCFIDCSLVVPRPERPTTANSLGPAGQNHRP